MEKNYSSVTKQTNNKFLNMYNMDAIARDGSHFNYYFATRREDGDLMCQTGILRSDAVVMYPICKEDPNKIILLRQYRYPIGDYIYELPAGLVDKGEEPNEAAIREIKEETGLLFTPVPDYNGYFTRPFIQSQGLCDECNTTIFGFAEGELSDKDEENSERIEAFKADKAFVKDILKNKLVSIRAAYLLTLFLNSDPKNPFKFLKV